MGENNLVAVQLKEIPTDFVEITTTDIRMEDYGLRVDFDGLKYPLSPPSIFYDSVRNEYWCNYNSGQGPVLNAIIFGEVKSNWFLEPVT